MEITCLIPTMGERLSGIVRCAESLRGRASYKILKNSTGWLPAVNKALREVEGYFLMGGDDMTFFTNAIDIAMETMEDNYPDGDGVIGLNQSNMENFCKAGFVLVGRKFIDRFPDSQLYCPDYLHYFSDPELMAFAKSINRFTYAEDAKVLHFHPAVTGKQDETNKVSRTRWKHDKDVSNKRLEKGYLWGENFASVL